MNHLRWNKNHELLFYDKRLRITRDYYNLHILDFVIPVTDSTVEQVIKQALKALAYNLNLGGHIQRRKEGWHAYLLGRYFPGSVHRYKDIPYFFRCQADAERAYIRYKRRAAAYIASIDDYHIPTYEEQVSNDEERARAYRAGNVSYVALP